MQPDERAAKNLIIRQNLCRIPEYNNARTILFYASFRTEVETFTLIRESLSAGKRVVLPKVDRGHGLALYEIRHTDELSPGCMGIPEPHLQNDRLVSIWEIDVVIIPGAGYDRSGNRLGYGKGCYDMLLSGMKGKVFIIAPAYEEQIIGHISAEGHDVRVDMIVTDKQVVRVHAS